MASPAWLPRELQPSASQASVSVSYAGGPPGGYSTPTAAPNPVVGTPASQVAVGTAADSMQESAQAKFVTASGYGGPSPSFSYSVLPSADHASECSQQSFSGSVMMSDSLGSSPVIRPPVPGLSTNSSPSFMYSILPAGMGFPKSQQFPSSMSTAGDVAQDEGDASAVPSVSQSLPLLAHSNESSAITGSSTPNLGPATSAPSVPLLQVPPGMPGTPVTPRPLGTAPSVVLPSNSIVPLASMDSSSALPRPIMPTPVLAGPAVQQQAYPPYPSMPPMVAAPQGPWLQPPHINGLPRPPFLPYPAAFPSPFPSPVHGVSLPSVRLSNSQPPGVTPVAAPCGTSTYSVASSNQLAIGSGSELELPPGIDAKDGTVINELPDAWTAHRTETGAVYYYNALTGESTYEKPPGFKGEPNKATARPTPVSCEKLAGADWVLVTTNDGKKYYHNSKTKMSSWEIPTEVTKMKKKQDGDALKNQTMSVPNTNTLTDKGSGPVSLSAPAVNTGGRDATPLKALGVPVSSSALDMIKKKLQDSGAPATSSPFPALLGAVASDINVSKAVESTVKGSQSETSKDNLKDSNGDGNMSESSSDSEDVDSGPTKEECIIQFKEMLRERGVAPFSKWEKELPKIVFDPRFKAISNHSARRALFEHYVRTRAEEERKEKRAAQKAAVEGFKQLLEEAKEDIDHGTDYQTFKRKWGNDPRFEALHRKDREALLNERVLPLKKAAERKAEAIRAASASSFKAMLREKGDIMPSSRWSKVKDCLRDDQRYKSVKHDDREALFNEYISELKAAEEEAEQVAKVKWEEEEKLKERERALRKRKEREEQEVERVRSKTRRKEAVESYQALLVETIKDPQASWTESKSKLEKDPQGRAANPYLDQSDLEKLFRDHIKILHERSVHEFRALLAELITAESAAQEKEDGKTVLNSWSTAKRLLKADMRYAKTPRKDRESLWRQHVEDIQRRHKLASDREAERYADGRSRSSADCRKYLPESRRY